MGMHTERGSHAWELPGLPGMHPLFKQEELWRQ